MTIFEISGQTILMVYGCGENTSVALSAANNFAGEYVAFNTVAGNSQTLINPTGNFTIVHH